MLIFIVVFNVYLSTSLCSVHKPAFPVMTVWLTTVKIRRLGALGKSGPLGGRKPDASDQNLPNVAEVETQHCRGLEASLGV